MIVVPPSPSSPSHAVAKDSGESLILGEMTSETMPSAIAEETGRDGDIAEAVMEAVSPDKSLVERLFDRVIVISLEQSVDRRAHIAQHLPAFGIRQYEFFTATSATDPLVAQAYSDGEVATFPPCFRCGQIDCGNPDCNNFLIPQQVATFITYRRLWQVLAEGDAGRILVVEDDVRFHDHITTVLTFLEAEIVAGSIPFEAEKPCLIRLGWALCGDHENLADCSVSTDVKMANPCHSLTREYARVLLSRYAGIHHTVDEYQHRQAPQPGESFTVYPPIASELSWSDGAFDSLIHPKVVRSAYLHSHDRQDEADANDRLVEKHIKKKYYRPILIVGHPRCGTGYAAGLCRQIGVDVGHEKLGKDGISSWMFAVEADQNPYFLDDVAKTRRALAWRHLVMPVRNLLDAAPSVMRELQYAPPAYEFLKTHIRQELGVDIEAFENPLERAVWSITSWARIVLAMNPGLWFRIEDGHERLKMFLCDNGLVAPPYRDISLDTQPVNADKFYKGVRYPKPVVREEDWKVLSKQTWDEIRWYQHYFGYGFPAELARPAAFTHLILTRFNLKQLEREPVSVAWHENRFALFENICYPSVRYQTNQNFLWLVFFDEDTPPHLKSKIEKWAGWKNFVPIYTSCEIFFGFHFPSELKPVVAAHIDTLSTHLITTRLDNDDAIHADFVQRLQDEFDYPELAAVNFEYGWQIQGRSLYAMRMLSNPFISLIEKYDRDAFKTVYVRGHGQLPQLCPVRNIADEGRPAWIQVIHDDNLVNNCCYGTNRSLDLLKNGFENCNIDAFFRAEIEKADACPERAELPNQRKKTIIPLDRWNEFTEEFYRHADAIDELREVFRKYRHDPS